MKLTHWDLKKIKKAAATLKEANNTLIKACCDLHKTEGVVEPFYEEVNSIWAESHRLRLRMEKELKGEENG